MASASPPPKAKFSVYQNPSFSAALTAKSLRPSASALLVLLLASIASASAVLAAFTRERSILDGLPSLANVSASFSYFATKAFQVLSTLAFLGTLSAIVKAWVRRHVQREFELKRAQEKDAVLTRRQLGLLGLKPKPEETAGSPLKPPKSQRTPSEPLVPVRKSSIGYSPARSSRTGTDRQFPSAGGMFGISPVSPGFKFEAGAGTGMSPISPAPTYAVSPGTPWSKSSGKDIKTEEMLEQFLADADERIVEATAQAAASSPSSIRGFGIASPGSVGSSVTTSGAARSTPLRPVRISPGSHQKYGTPPKKAEGELPTPMSIEEMVAGFEGLGIYQELDKWRDRLRQWFSSVLLGPLVEKIETSHLQVMQSATSLGISITVNKVGADSLITPVPLNVSPIDGTKEWQPTFTLDEDGLLHQLRSYLVQVRDASAAHVSQAGAHQLQQTNLVPIMQTCINAITEHQRLNALMKGELVKGLLPQSSVRADYTVRRVQELAEGTCVKNYEYVAKDEVYDKVNKKWTKDLPSDSHLLGYLFCCFLDHPKWMLHVEPTSYSSTQSSKNPLFLGCLPPKEKFPEKYVAVISSAPFVIHPGACILVIGKQSPPILTLYWDKKMQFSLQGRTAVWDAILLLCHRIEEGFGGVVRGLHLGSAAFNILPILESEEYD